MRSILADPALRAHYRPLCSRTLTQQCDSKRYVLLIFAASNLPAGDYYTAPGAADIADNVSSDANIAVQCTPAAGTAANFPTSQSTKVTCTATDEASNTASCDFYVRVNDDSPLTCPANQQLTANGRSCM